MSAALHGKLAHATSGSMLIFAIDSMNMSFGMTFRSVCGQGTSTKLKTWVKTDMYLYDVVTVSSDELASVNA
jgi:hypothetical protein